MSSNIRLKRICKSCGKEFEARTTVTQSSSDTCSKRWYKTKKQNDKIDASNTETKKIIMKPIEAIKAKEFLTVRDVAKLINCSRQTVYNLINNGTLKATNLIKRKTLVKRSEIDKLFL